MQNAIKKTENRKLKTAVYNTIKDAHWYDVQGSDTTMMPKASLPGQQSAIGTQQNVICNGQRENTITIRSKQQAMPNKLQPIKNVMIPELPDGDSTCNKKWSIMNYL